MSKPWQTTLWRKKRTEFIKGKKCAWCGSTEILVIDHNETFKPLAEYNKVAWGFFANYFSENKHQEELEELKIQASANVTIRYFEACPQCGYSVKPRKTMTPTYKCYKCLSEFEEPTQKIHRSTISYINRTLFLLFQKNHKEEISVIYEKKKNESDKKYYAFENVTVLCKKCNFARLKGLILCKECGEKYHKPNYNTCFNCFSKTEKGQKIAKEREKLPYEHPWCQKTFFIERRWWEFEARPLSCCIEHCKEDCNNCPTAIEHYNKKETD
jgi:hypothetical protein